MASILDMVINIKYNDNDTKQKTDKTTEGFTKQQASIVALQSAYNLYSQVATQSLRVMKEVYKFVDSAVKGYEEEQLALMSLTNVLKQNNQMVDSSVVAIQRLAQKYNDLGVASDDEIIKNANLQVAMGYTVSQAIKNIDAIVALKAGMEQGRGSTVSLSEATVLYRQILDGQTRGLKSAGIALDENILKSKDIVKINNEINKSYGETVNLMAGTWLQQQKAMANAWDNTREAMGKFFVSLAGGNGKSVEGTVKTINGLTSAIENLSFAMTNFRDTGFAKAMGNTIKYLEYISPLMGDFIRMFKILNLYGGVEKEKSSIEDYKKTYADITAELGKTAGTNPETSKFLSDFISKYNPAQKDTEYTKKLYELNKEGKLEEATLLVGTKIDEMREVFEKYVGVKDTNINGDTSTAINTNTNRNTYDIDNMDVSNSVLTTILNETQKKIEELENTKGLAGKDLLESMFKQYKTIVDLLNRDTELRKEERNVNAELEAIQANKSVSDAKVIEKRKELYALRKQIFEINIEALKLSKSPNEKEYTDAVGKIEKLYEEIIKGGKRYATDTQNTALTEQYKILNKIKEVKMDIQLVDENTNKNTAKNISKTAEPNESISNPIFSNPAGSGEGAGKTGSKTTWDYVTEAVDRYTVATTIADSATSGIMATINDLVAGGSLTWRKFGDLLVSIFKDILVQLIKMVIQTFIFRTLLSALGIGGAVAVPAVPKVGFAKGGVITSPTLALLGEAGQNEFVTPEKTFEKKWDEMERRFAGKSTATVINNYYDNTMFATDEERTKSAVERLNRFDTTQQRFVLA